MRKSGKAILAATCLAVSALPARAQDSQAVDLSSQARRGVDDPRAFVEQIYARYRAAPNTPPVDPVYSYSDRLRRLFAAYDAWQARHQDLVGSLAFDWWTNSQDWDEIRIAELREQRRGPDRRVVVARFIVFDRESVNRFQFVRQSGRWYLDDVVNGNGRGDDGWTLSALLRERPE